MDDNIKKFRRRNFLKTTGIVGFGAMGTGRAVGEKPDEYGSLLFVEMGVTNRLELPEVSGSFLKTTIDDVIYHRVDPSQGELYLDETADDSTKRKFKNNQHLTKYVDYYSIPSSIQQIPISNLVTNLGRAYRRTGGLITTTVHHSPTINIVTRDREGPRSVKVSSGRKEAVVGPRSTQKIPLLPRNVKIPVVKQLNEKVENETIPEHKRAKKQKREQIDISVTPEVWIRNYGRLEVIESSPGRSSQ